MHMEDMTYYCFGRYGERIAIEEMPEDKYLVSCEELGMGKAVLTQEEFDAFTKRYALDGVPEFDKSDSNLIRNRAINMGRRLVGCYREFDGLLSRPEKDRLECLRSATEIYRLLQDVEVLDLTPEQYEKWFLRLGWSKTNEETEEYVAFIREARKQITKGQC